MPYCGFNSYPKPIWHRPPGQDHTCPRPRIVSAPAVLGIDLGTSNSAVAIIEAGKARSVGDATTPSWVAFTEEDVLVGSRAQRQAVLNPDNTFSSVKRVIGRHFSDVQAELQHAAHEGRQAADGGVELWCPARGIGFSPQEVSSHILRQLIRQAEHALQEKADAAVIAVPAHFSARQRAATLEAGRLAGLSRLQLLQEPVAAALAYGLGIASGEDELILVFDLGGGTFDVSLVECFEGCLEVLATGGDAHLGGDDWDRVLLECVLQQQPPASQHRCREPAAMQRLAEAVEAAKRELSEAEAASVRLPFWGRDGGELRAAVTRRHFEAAAAPLLARLWPPIDRLGREACLLWAHRPACAEDREGSPERQGGVLAGQAPGKGAGRFAPAPRRVKRAVLVGGATRMPAIRDFVRAVTGVPPQTTVDPALCVALGAAVYGGVLEGNVAAGPELADGAYSWALHDRASGFPA